MHFYRGSGHGAARYFDEGHRGAEAYYSEQESAAVAIDTWSGGRRAGTSVLAGPGDLMSWVEGRHPATGEEKGVVRSGGKDRQPLRFVEVVVNNPKSLSIVASQNPVVASAYERVLTRQADEIAAYLSAVAVTRTGRRGAQHEVGGLTVETARVTHLTSREGDPHRHIHLMLNTRVMTPDGVWHGLHSAGIRQHIRAINERGSRVLLTDLELRRALSSEGYSLGKDGELDQARDAVELMSKRSAQVAANREAFEAAWREEHPGREPSQRVKNGWDQQGWAEGRKQKPRGLESEEELSVRVGEELARAGFDFTLGARERIALDEQLSIGAMDRDAVAEETVAVLSSHKSTWSEAELTAEVESALTRSGVLGDPQAVTEAVEDCRARAASRCLSVLDPDLHAPTVMSRHLSSEAVLEADMALNLGLAGLVGREGRRDSKGGLLALKAGLHVQQAEAVEAVCGSCSLEVVVGPAGTGKTKMLAVAKERLDHQGRQMIVVSPTRKGAQVAGAEVGVGASSLSKLVYEHGFRWDDTGRWWRLEPGALDTVTGRPYEGPSPGAVLSGASVVVVDEAGLLSVDQANALIDVIAHSGAVLRLVGDPRQLGAVGRGGVMETATRWAGPPVTLEEVHRFLRTGPDEAGMPLTSPDQEYGALSLLMREGDPERAASGLFERGAVVVHGDKAEAIRAIATEVAGELTRETGLSLTVATNDDALLLNEAVRERRVAAGVVDDNNVVEGMAGVRVGRGDRIVTRRNDTGRNVANREAWTVEAVKDDGILARDGERRVHLDKAYVAEAVQLGYAVTDYGNQGVTTDRSMTLVTEATTSGGLYVGATRGRYGNDLHVVAGDLEAARSSLVAALRRDRADRGLDAGRAEAEKDAVAVPPAPEQQVGQESFDRTGFDPTTWHSAAELDKKEKQVEARHRKGMGSLRDVPVISEEVRLSENRADRSAADEARSKAAWHWSEAYRIAGGWNDLFPAAAAAYFAARDDARIIEAGPGRFGRKAAKVEAALARRQETARTWSGQELPGSHWSDVAVDHAARWATERTIGPPVDHQRRIAEREEQTAATHDRRIKRRDDEQQIGLQENEDRAMKRDALSAVTDRDRAAIAHARQVRAELVETMSPKQVTVADKSRDTYLSEQARQLKLARQQEQARQPHEHSRERGGPGLGL